MSEPATRRQRQRAETENEIKERAWRAMEESGATELSLRDVARQMGMAPSALYRYYPSRTDLLQALAVDAFESIGRVVTEAYASARREGLDALEGFVRIATAYRSWAHAHRAQYALLFATKLPDYQGTPQTSLAAMRSFGVLMQVTADAVDEESFDLARLEHALGGGLRAALQNWAEMTGQQVPAASLAASLWCYTAMHGAISLELNGHLPPPVVDNPAFFESVVRAMVEQVRSR